jgi:diaminopimelate epimerase
VLTEAQIKKLADRRFGIGCDQLLLVEASQTSDVDFRYRIFNADGHEVQQCGNGARCFARFVRDKGLTQKHNLVVETQAGFIYPQLEDNNEVSVDMGLPQWQPAALPFQADMLADYYDLAVEAQVYAVGAVSMGNPHVVLKVESVDIAPVVRVGAQLSHHPRFPQGVNVGFMQILDRTHICLRVYERGVGETLACGTGACAAVVIGIRWRYLETSVTVDLPGGQLQIEWAGTEDASVRMRGPAVSVFEGSIEL